jgi:hypothetical protein
MVEQNINPVTHILTTVADSPTSAGLIDRTYFNGDDSYTQTVVLRGISAGPGASVSLQPVGYYNGVLQNEIVIGIGAGGPGTVFDVDAVGVSPISVTGGPVTTSGTFIVSIQPASDTQNGYLSSTDKIKLDNLSGVNTGDQTITLIGDVSGSAPPASNTVITTTLTNTGVTPGTYANPVITVDAKGRVISAVNGSPLIPGEINIGQNIGPGHDIFATKVGVALQFKTITSDPYINIADFSDHLEFGLNLSNLLTYLGPFITGQDNIGENLGTSVNGAGLYAGMDPLNPVALTFKRVIGDGNIIVEDVTPTINSIQVGVGPNIPLLNQPNLFTGQQNTALVTLAATGGVVWDLNLGNVAILYMPSFYTAASATPVTGGTGYLLGDVLTVVGGTFTTAAQLTVTSIASGAINGVSVTNVGAYTAIPNNPVSVTGGAGAGATFNMIWNSSGNQTLLNPFNIIAGGVYYLIVVNNVTGNGNLNFGPIFKWPCGGLIPTLTQSPNAIDLFQFVSIGTLILGIETKNFK